MFLAQKLNQNPHEGKNRKSALLKVTEVSGCQDEYKPKFPLPLDPSMTPGWKVLHKGRVLEALLSMWVQWHGCVGSKHTDHRGKPEFSSYRADRAMNQAQQDVKIIFKLSVVECGVLFSVIALTVGDRASKKQVH